MIQVSKILSELYGTGKSVVGFRQPINPDYDILTGANIESSSGIYLESGIVTIENIKNTQEYADISDANFNIQLANFIKDSIINACNLVFQKNDKLEYGLVYKNKNPKTETLDNNTDFVGFQVNPLKTVNITAIINGLLAEFNSAGSITVYLFHSSQQTALQSTSITLTENNVVEKAVEWVLDTQKQYGGCFYIGYFTSGLIPKAINRSLDTSYYRDAFKKISFEPIIVKDVTGTDLFDITQVQYVSDTFGLNFNASVLEDYTEYIIDNKNRFATLIKYQFQADMLRMMLSSNQSNSIEVNIKNNALKELDGILTQDGKVYSQGILRKLENEAHRLYKEFINKDEYPIITSV